MSRIGQDGEPRFRPWPHIAKNLVAGERVERFLDPTIVAEHSRNADHFPDLLRMPDRHLQGNATAHAVPQQVRSWDFQVVEQGSDVIGEVFMTEVAIDIDGAAMALQLDGDHLPALGQLWEQVGPVVGDGHERTVQQADYRPRVAVIDAETLESRSLAPNGGPALVVGYNHYSIQWFPIGRRLVGSYSLGFAVVDPDRLSWTRVDLPEGFTMRPHVITDHEWVFPSHRFDAQRGTFKPSPPVLQRLGGQWLPFGRSVVAIDPISRMGAEVSLLSGKETPLSFDGFPVLAGHVLVWKLAAKQLLVVGQTPPPAQVKASVYDLEARRWLPIADEQLTFLRPDRLTSFTVEGAPGVWIDQPEGPQRPKVLYQLDPKTLTFASHPLPTGLSVAAAPNGVFVFDATSLRQVQPDAHSPTVGGESGVGAIEALEELALPLLGNAHPLVPHRHHRHGTPRRERDPHGASFGGELDGVVEQVGQHLIHPVPVRVHQRGAVLLEHQPVLGGDAPHALQHLVHQLAQLEALALQGEPPELESGDLEQLLHELGEPIALPVEDLEGLALSGLVPSRRPAIQELGIPLDAA